MGIDLKKAANEIMVQAVRQTEDRVAEVKRRAEDAVNDVKRQAVIELQKAVAVAETKANDLVVAERAKMEKILSGWFFFNSINHLYFRVREERMCLWVFFVFQMPESTQMRAR